jgi:hypothetical protein
MKIYVASSWRNELQPEVVVLLRRLGHEVYDFRNPAPGNTGFRWSDCAVPGVDWQDWTPEEYRQALQHPIAAAGYGHDIGALRACDACVLVLPSGRSASWEFGYAMGQGKRGAVLQLGKVEPELMYREAEILTSWMSLRLAFTDVRREAPDSDDGIPFPEAKR